MSIDQEGGWKIRYHDDSCVSLMDFVMVAFADFVAAVLATTNPLRSDRTRNCHPSRDQPSSTPETAFRIFQPRRKPISSSQRRATVCSSSFPSSVFLSAHTTQTSSPTVSRRTCPSPSSKTGLRSCRNAGRLSRARRPCSRRRKKGMRRTRSARRR